MSSFIPTPQHKAIFAATRSAKRNIIISAVAGSGKTTTLIELLKCLPVTATDSLIPPSVTFLAFNKNIAEELKTRVPSHVQCSTFHSLGFRALKRVLPSNGREVKVDGRKVSKIVWDAVGFDNPDSKSIIQLVGLLKSVAPDQGTATARSDEETYSIVQSLAEQYDVSLESPDDAYWEAVSALSKSNANLSLIDFDDMLYLPVLLGAPFDKQDVVLVDESQDTNDIQLEILERLGKVSFDGHSSSGDATFLPSSFYVFVGDPHQAIYGFRGANTDSMSRIATRFNCESFPLSVSYRCPKRIVEEARKWMKE